MLRPAFKKILGESNTSDALEENDSDEQDGKNMDIDAINDDESATNRQGLENLKNSNSSLAHATDEELDFDNIDRHIFELQLNQLQEQLVAAIIENQNLGEEIKQLSQKDDQKSSDYKELRKQNAHLAAEVAKLHRSNENLTNTKKKKDDPTTPEPWQKIDVADFGADNTIEASIVEHPAPISSRTEKWNSLKDGLIEFMWDRISDFELDNDDDKPLLDDQEEPLSIKKLKENVSRFSNALIPFKNVISRLSKVFLWKHPIYTSSVFIYMYCAWYGMVLPLFSIIGVLHLSRNYLIMRGVIVPTADSSVDGATVDNSKDDIPSSWSGRYQLVLGIAKKVQNRLGYLADSLEKIQSLVTWRHMEATRKLWMYMVFFSVLCLLISGEKVLLVVGVLLGIKVFIVSPIYDKFPRVKKRYDEIDRLWNELPTQDMEDNRQTPQDAQPIIEKSSSSKDTSKTVAAVVNHPDNEDALAVEDNPADESSSTTSNWETNVFCDRFNISRKEVPLSGWAEGRRCTLMNKESPLSNMKHGRLYLTKNYICFERNQFNSKKNVVIKLTDVLSTTKTKPFSFLPGSGMAIDIKMRDTSKSYMFAAMVGRDDSFDGIMRAARALSLPWAMPAEK